MSKYKSDKFFNPLMNSSAWAMNCIFDIDERLSKLEGNQQNKEQEKEGGEENENEWNIKKFCMGGFEDPMFFADDGWLFIYEQKECMARRGLICNVNDILLVVRAMTASEAYLKASYFVAGVGFCYERLTFDSVNSEIIRAYISNYDGDSISLGFDSAKFIEFLEANSK